MTISIKEIIDHRQTDFTGKHVLCRSNEDEPIRVGTCMGYQQIHSSKFPIVEMWHDRKEYMVMGIVMEYTAERLAFFNMLSPKEQWCILENEISVRDFCKPRNGSSQEK